MPVRIAEVDRIREIVVDDRIGSHRPALVIVQMVIVQTPNERDEPGGVDAERNAVKSGG